MPPDNTPPVVPPTGESTTIQEMRSKVDQANTAQKVAEQAATDAKKESDDLKLKISESDKAKLDETDRLRVELKEAQDKVVKLDQQALEIKEANDTFENQYNSLIISIPKEQQETIKSNTQSGTWPQRINLAITMAGLIGVKPPVVTVNGVTQPGAATPPAGTTSAQGTHIPTKEEVANFHPPGWGTAFNKQPS